MGSISDKNIKKCIAAMKYIFTQEKEVTQNIIIIVTGMYYGNTVILLDFTLYTKKN